MAEAKPVGLAIAGVGGVASSKPVATAIVGPGGLAVARPVATAIAGISPHELSGLGIPLAANHKRKAMQAINRFAGPINRLNKYGFTVSEGRDLLVGPQFSLQSRVNDKDIAADEANENRIQSADKPKKKEEFKQPASEAPAANPIGTSPFAHPLLPNPYPFISPMYPVKLNWENEPIESAPGYEPIPFLDRSFNQQYYPPQPYLLEPYNFYNFQQ